jgi:hypothetical protein
LASSGASWDVSLKPGEAASHSGSTTLDGARGTRWVGVCTQRLVHLGGAKQRARACLYWDARKSTGKYSVRYRGGGGTNRGAIAAVHPSSCRHEVRWLGGVEGWDEVAGRLHENDLHLSPTLLRRSQRAQVLARFADTYALRCCGRGIRWRPKPLVLLPTFSRNQRHHQV